MAYLIDISKLLHVLIELINTVPQSLMSTNENSSFKEPTTKELSDFIREILLPKINDLELEVTKLRRVTWPVCQKILEENQLDKIPEKKKFLKGLDQDEVKLLLKLKSNGSLLDHEYRLVTTFESYVNQGF
jgi:hypothetical protein